MGKVARDETLQRVANAVEAIALGAGSPDAGSWKSIQNLVRAGMGPKAFPVGTQFVVRKENSLSAAMGVHTGISAVSINEETFLAAAKNVGTGVHEFAYNGSAWIYDGAAVNLTNYGISVTGTPASGDEVIVTEAFSEVIWDVVHHKTVNGSPRMVLLMHEVIYSKQFDQKEALFTAAEALPAGPYCFTIKNDGWQSQNDTVIYFTLANELPVGGQLRLSGFNPWDAAFNGKNLSAFASGSSTTATETVAMTTTPIDSATDLGDTDGTVNLNYFQRLAGSNNYKESAIRQWINSDKAANNWWKSTNKFDVTPDYANVAGLLHGMDEDFLDVVQETVVPCKTNNTFELPGWTLNTAYTVKDRFYLASRDELGYGVETVAEGSKWDMYDGAANVDRIKYDISAKTTARTWWVRSPDPSAGSPRCVGTSGALHGYHAYHGRGAAAACEIG